MYRFRIAALFVALFGSLWAFIATEAMAQEKGKTFAVTPFTIMGPENYAYLGPAIQGMLTSRLTWRGHFDPVESSGVAGAGVPSTASQARETMQKLGTDFLVFGSATIVGEDVSLDVQVVDAAGNHWPKSSSVKLNSLIPAMEGVAQSINAEVFKRPGAGTATAVAAQQGQPRQQVQMMNPDLIYNEQDARQDFFLNPYFRQQENPDQAGRWRSQALPIVAASMVVDDLDGDGQNEIIMGDDSGVYVYTLRQGRLDQIATYSLPSRVRLLRLNTFTFAGDSRPSIIVSGLAGEYQSGSTSIGDPWSMVLVFEQDRLRATHERITLFMNVIQSPPLFRKQLIGQRRGDITPFDSTVHEVVFSGGNFSLGPRLHVPRPANVFNFAFYPSRDSGQITLLADDSDKIRMYTAEGRLLAATGDEYANSPVGILYPQRISGMAVTSEPTERNYYIPARLLLERLSDPQRYDLIVSRNISVAARLFESYRNFPYGEIHSLYYDGVGLSLIWKTRRLKGTVVDYQIADLDGDGNPELIVCVHTFPGSLGLQHRRTVVEAYKLALDQLKPGGAELDIGE